MSAQILSSLYVGFGKPRCTTQVCNCHTSAAAVWTIMFSRLMDYRPLPSSYSDGLNHSVSSEILWQLQN